ncbi:hypothetical protein KLL36_07820 [Clostridioides difficile]|uniref:hypothetical protein n=1 Tax=Clostridioides difficile TaxID=1496 RepID=UPI0018FEB0E3|nr:hypothetical protein [Clostridioides difficile]MDL5065932.1 hypothetical protein [Clostridioides difficile]MDN9453351.1 hypothetical protein [Clostridioides difficile]HBF7898341.1 hypothetical protein [Clostridioides difficile]HBF7900949.1 hypothetical protein [Clostridioides difficile]
MVKKQLTYEQKRLDTDIWIIILVTLGVFLCYVAFGNQLMSFVANSDVPVTLRLLLNASVQFGVAGLGITIVCILRKEKFTMFGLTKKNLSGQSWGLYYASFPISSIYLFLGNSMAIDLLVF